MESPGETDQHIAMWLGHAAKALLLHGSAWIVLDLGLLALCCAILVQYWRWKNTQNTSSILLSSSTSPLDKKDTPTDYRLILERLERFSVIKTMTTPGTSITPFSYQELLSRSISDPPKYTTFPVGKFKRVGPVIAAPITLIPPLRANENVVEPYADPEESEREKWLGSAQPVLSALLPFFVVFARDLANEQDLPLQWLSRVTLGLLLVTIGALQAYGQERAKRYRNAAQAQIDSIGAEICRVGRGVDSIGADLRSIADEIAAEGEA